MKWQSINVKCKQKCGQLLLYIVLLFANILDLVGHAVLKVGVFHYSSYLFLFRERNASPIEGLTRSTPL